MADWRLELGRRLRGEVLLDERLAPRTTIKVGGPAGLLARPADLDDLVALLRAAAELGAPLSVLGGGANTLVADAGVEGVVLRLPPDLAEERAEGELLTLPAGAPIARLMARAHAHGLTGAEFSVGIPGTLGGAVAMNAGTRQGEMKDVLARVELATAEGVGFVPAAALGLAYRHSALPAGAVVTRVEVRLAPGDVAASRATMEADVARRRASQPLTQPTFGSTFANPPGDHAGRLIEAVGLKGHRIGGAAWSEVHANFLVNQGGATAEELLRLMGLARSRVQERFGVRLRPEVRPLGRFPPELLAEAGLGEAA